MSSAIFVTAGFDSSWPLAADHLHRRWAAEGPVQFHRLADGDRRPLAAIASAPAAIARIIVLGREPETTELAPFTGLREFACSSQACSGRLAEPLTARGVACYGLRNESYWSRSLAEFGLAMTINGLRRIPQLHAEIRTRHQPWDFTGSGQPGTRGQQFGDDPAYVNGTVHGKRVRIAGLGNIGGIYAGFCSALGAEVAAWDPHIPDASFALARVERRFHLEDLLRDAEIFAPILPLRPQTEGLITAELVRALPRGCLVLLITRAQVVDVPTLRQRVLAGELALAADVFDREPLPLDDPLLGHPAVVHTPHIAGRTAHANQTFADHLAEQFRPLVS